MQNAILYQAYGGTDFINECRYSLLKYLQVYNVTPPPQTGIVVYTDQPEAFADFFPYFNKMQCRQIATDTIQRWRGHINFVHRVKIEMMHDFLGQYSGNLLYCDTDTYITSPIEPIFEEIERGQFFMHEFEGVLDKNKSPSFHKWEKFLSTTPVAFNDKKVEFSKTLKMYNAGVVGLNSSNKYVLQDVLALTDSVYQKFPKHIAEQFAFSYCLQKKGTVKAANHLIAHYWNLKEFRKLLQSFFSSNAEESIPSLVKKINHLDALTIMQHKMAYEALPFWQRLSRKFSGKAWKIDAYTRKL